MRHDLPMPPVHSLIESRDARTPGRLRWRIAPVGADGRTRWAGELLDPAGRCLARTGHFATRNDAVRVVERAIRVAHVEDCYRRLHNDASGLQFLLAEPAGGVLLIGSPQPTTLERERAIVALKSSARAAAPPDVETVGASAG